MNGPEPGAPSPAPSASARLATRRPIDLALTLAPLRHGRDDPTIQLGPDAVWLARATAAGPATLRLRAEADAILAEAWGPGAAQALEAAPGLAGLLDDPTALVARQPIVAELQQRFAGLRLPRTGQLAPALIPAAIEDRAVPARAQATYLALLRRLGSPAPGPLPLLLPPSAADLAALSRSDFERLGLDRRAELLRRIGEAGPEIEALMALGPEQARGRLQEMLGIRPWIAAEATRAAFGDPDAVSPGDARLPDLVSWALARKLQANEEMMLELLEPYRGQRARVVRLLGAANLEVPRFGPLPAPRRKLA
jgi:3-methyladenine DNA glycosylase/8-oxoguanine DNA glycosylase